MGRVSMKYFIKTLTFDAQHDSHMCFAVSQSQSCIARPPVWGGDQGLGQGLPIQMNLNEYPLFLSVKAYPPLN